MLTDIITLILTLIFGILLILAFVFWFHMLTDCVHKRFKNKINLTEWFILIIFTFILGAFLYYLFVKRKGLKTKDNKKSYGKLPRRNKKAI